jgi:hypothetical protein
LSLELGDITDGDYDGRKRSLAGRTRIELGAISEAEEAGSVSERGEFMRRWAARHREAFASVGGGPEAFETFLNEGYYDGRSMARSTQSSESCVGEFRFLELPENMRGLVGNAVKVRLETCMAALVKLGVVGGLSKRDEAIASVKCMDDSISLDITVKRPSRGTNRGQLFAVTWRRREAAVFELFEKSVESSDLTEWHKRADSVIGRRVDATWNLNCADVDWYILGFFKGVLVEFAKDIRLDRTACDASQGEALNWLVRRSIEVCEFHALSTELVLKLVYRGIGSQDSLSAVERALV